MPRTGPTIAGTALQLIRERGPQQLDALVPEIVAAGRTRARDPRAAVRAAIDVNPEFIQAWDGRWCSLVDQLEGAIFAAPVTRLERADGVVILNAQLELLRRLALLPRPLVGGGDVHLDLFGDFYDLPWHAEDLEDGELREALGPGLAADLLGFLLELGLPPQTDETDALRELVDAMSFVQVLHGPEGWLPPLGPRQLLGIRVRAGAVEALALDRRDVTGPHVGVVAAKVARLARLVIGPDPSWFGPPAIELEELLELVATEAPELLRRPLPPFAEVVVRGGLEVHDGWVGHRGTDWEATGLLAPIDLEEAWGYEAPDTVN